MSDVRAADDRFREWLNDRWPQGFQMPTRARAIEDTVEAAREMFGEHSAEAHADHPATPAKPIKRITDGVREMLGIIESPDATDDEKSAAASTIVEAVAPDIMEEAAKEARAMWEGTRSATPAEGEGIELPNGPGYRLTTPPSDEVAKLREENQRLRERADRRMCMCIYCGESIPVDPNDIAKSHEIIKAHDRICRDNPIVAERDRLQARLADLESLRELVEDFVPVNSGEGAIAKQIRVLLCKLTPAREVQS